MDDFYQGFVQKAAAARKMRPEAIDAVAQGRVWTGRQARERGLVDALGGLDRAVAVAKERAGIAIDEDVELVTYPPRRTLYEVLTESVGGVMGDPAGIVAALAGPEGPALRAIGALTAPMRLFRRGEPLALMPYAFIR